ncbi:MAG: recombinase zinc beta ribbon domain-containing protein [Clostridia bacterium]|nr:recombinase zinc beta ribbon domain-containing protein [Clostridia bacterium]
MLICGECGTPYRRCTWTGKSEKKIVWRCISRLDYGKKYCHKSPSMEEGPLQRAIMDAILKVAEQNADILKNLKLHIGMAMEGGESEDKSLGIQIRLAEIDTEFKRLLKEVASNISLDTFDDTQMSELMNEKHRLEQQLAHYEDTKQKRENTKSRLDEIFTVMEGLKNHPLTYDDKIVRQILECVIVESKEKIKVVFIGGMEVEQELG